MTPHQLATAWLLALLALIPSQASSAPAPKEKPRTTANEHEEEVEPAQLTFFGARRARTTTTNNLKLIALGVLNYESAYAKFPQNVTDKNGKALLSWRVQLLPYLEQEKLYKQFKLDEPWDSENNLKLLSEMPKVFESPRVKVKNKGFTIYRGFEGNGAVFGSNCTIAGITDGTSNTILCVESSVAVPWTKPVDLPFDPEKDLPDFGKAYGGEPTVVMCDGSTRSVNTKKVSAKTLKSAISINGGELLGDDW
jgi:hypothetical protein